MAPLVQLLAGILVAAGIFAATLWSLAQTWRRTGWLRRAHAAAAGLTLAVMAGLAQGWVQLPVLLALPLLVAATGAALLETGWNRLLPLLLVLLALALAAGLPFQAAATSALPPARGMA